MFGSYIASHMNMKADIYILQAAQSESGAITRKWLYSKTINCRAEALDTLKGGKIIDQTVDGFYDQIIVRLKTTEQISRRARITAIRSSDGKSVFPEIERIQQPDIIFEIKNTHAVTDPFGKISYYETLLKKAVVQENDIYNP
ncbi:hypothetical protein EBU94_06695 [bacterium]|nr:hypothetical protein [bacterium]